MRHLLIPLIALVAVPAFGADSYTVDPTHSAALFSVSHLGISNTHGRFTGIDGSLTWDAAEAAKSSINVIIKTDTVNTDNEKRDQHLRLPDFFNTKQLPTATFASKSFTKIDDATYTVTGDLTLVGTTKPVTATVKKIGEGKDPWGGYRIGFETTFVLKRSDFNIKGVPGVGDDVTLTFALEGIKK
jgi:polyisoprenoid-binding protein YceI